MSTKKVLTSTGVSYLVNKIKLLLGEKVDKVTGKQLSTNDYTTAEKNKLAGISAGAEVNVNADWNASSGDAQILNKPANLVQDASYVHTDNNFTTAEKTKLSGIQAGAEANVNADWNAASGDAQILNKPVNLVQDANYVHTDNNFTTTEKNKLASLTPGGGGGGSITVDTALSSTSPNPVQNSTIYTALQGKVDKVTGKGLSTNDYTQAEKDKLAGIESGAEKNVVIGANLATSVAGDMLSLSYIDSNNQIQGTTVPTVDMYFDAIELLPQAFVKDVGYTNESNTYTSLTTTTSTTQGDEVHYSRNTVIPTATSSLYGLMSPTDKASLDACGISVPKISHIHDTYRNIDFVIRGYEFRDEHRNTLTVNYSSDYEQGTPVYSVNLKDSYGVISLIQEYAPSDVFRFYIEVENGVATSKSEPQSSIGAKTYNEVIDAMDSNKLVVLDIKWVTNISLPLGGGTSQIVSKEYKNLIGSYRSVRIEGSSALQFYTPYETIILKNANDPTNEYLYDLSTIDTREEYIVHFEYDEGTDVLSAVDRDGNTLDGNTLISDLIFGGDRYEPSFLLSISDDDNIYYPVGYYIDDSVICAKFVTEGTYYTATINIVEEPCVYEMICAPIGSCSGSGSVPIPLDYSSNPTYGIDGQVLKTNGDGTTSWVANGMYGYGSPIPVTTTSAMVDTSSIYVYIGPDQYYTDPVTGNQVLMHTHGDWYYYDSTQSDWVVGGTYAAGLQGDDGTTFIPSVSNAGVISWSNDGGKPNPSSVDIASIVTEAVAPGEVTNSGTGRLSVTLQANTFYRFTASPQSLEVTLASTTDIPHYHFSFHGGTSLATTLILPQNIVMPEDFAVEQNRFYEIDILYGYGVVQSWPETNS